MARVVLALAVACLVGAIAFTAPVGYSQTSSQQARSQVIQAYSAVLGAEKSGANVTSAVATLNTAISLIQEADQINSTNPAGAQALYLRAENLTSGVLAQFPALTAAGKASVVATEESLAVETAVLGALAVLAYVYVPKLFWWVWLRTHRGWRVKKR